MLDRERLAKEALQQRFDEALARLDNERSVAEYLRETNRLDAAKRADANIERMERTVLKFRSELS